MKKSICASALACASTICLLGVFAVRPCLSEDKPEPAKSGSLEAVPASARIGKVEVGVTTMEQLEAWFGQGRAYTGMHPHGGREWRSKETGCYISADGFNYQDEAAKERMVECFDICTKGGGGAFDDTDHQTRRISVDQQQLTILGGISLGMERTKVLELLANTGIKPAVTNNLITWDAPGYHHVCDATPNHEQFNYTTWSGQLTFRHNKLEEIRIDCQ